MTDPIDRSAILARRALLVSTALASMRCAPAPNTGPGDVDSAQVVLSQVPSAPASSAPPATSGSASATPSAVQDAPSMKWEDVMASAPDKTAPSTIPAAYREHVDSTDKNFAAVAARVGAVWAGVPGLCDATQPACRPAWRELGEKLKEARDFTRGGSPLCGGADGPRSLDARDDRRMAFLRKKLDEAQAHWGKVAAKAGPLAEQEWQKQIANSNFVPPMPCLSCMAPKVFAPYQTVLFAPDVSTLDAEATKRIDELTQGGAAATLRYEVWAHAAANEKSPAAVAKARGEAVVAALVKKGIKKDRIQLVVIGPGLPLGEDERFVEFLTRAD